MDVSSLDEDFLLRILQKARVSWDQFFIFHLIEDLQLFNSETVGSHSSSDRDSLYVYMLLGD